jgi:hypothetical protein
MLKSETLTKYKPHSQSQSSSHTQPMFILCDICYWCATYFDKTRNVNNDELTSFPIMSSESFTFDHNPKRGVELEFRPRRNSI